MMTAGEVAREFGVHRKTITRWEQKGLLSCIRTLGGHRRYRASDIAALLSQPYNPRPSNLPTPATNPRLAGAAPTLPGAEDWMFTAAQQGARAEAIAEAAGLSVPAVQRILRGARP